MRFVNVCIFILRTILGMRWNAERNHVPAVLETYLTNYAWGDWHLETKGCLWKSGIEVWNILRYSVALTANKPLSLMCVMYVTVCPSTSVDPGVFSSIHSCFPQTCPTVLSVFMTRVCVSVCVWVWERIYDIQDDGVTGGMILSEGCCFQTLLLSSVYLAPLFLQKTEESGPHTTTTTRFLFFFTFFLLVSALLLHLFPISFFPSFVLFQG